MKAKFEFLSSILGSDGLFVVSQNTNSAAASTHERKGKSTKYFNYVEKYKADVNSIKRQYKANAEYSAALAKAIKTVLEKRENLAEIYRIGDITSLISSELAINGSSYQSYLSLGPSQSSGKEDNRISRVTSSSSSSSTSSISRDSGKHGQRQSRLSCTNPFANYGSISSYASITSPKSATNREDTLRDSEDAEPDDELKRKMRALAFVVLEVFSTELKTDGAFKALLAGVVGEFEDIAKKSNTQLSQFQKKVDKMSEDIQGKVTAFNATLPVLEKMEQRLEKRIKEIINEWNAGSDVANLAQPDMVPRSPQNQQPDEDDEFEDAESEEELVDDYDEEDADGEQRESRWQRQRELKKMCGIKNDILYHKITCQAGAHKALHQYLYQSTGDEEFAKHGHKALRRRIKTRCRQVALRLLRSRKGFECYDKYVAQLMYAYRHRQYVVESVAAHDAELRALLDSEHEAMRGVYVGQYLEPVLGPLTKFVGIAYSANAKLLDLYNDFFSNFTGCSNPSLKKSPSEKEARKLEIKLIFNNVLQMSGKLAGYYNMSLNNLTTNFTTSLGSTLSSLKTADVSSQSSLTSADQEKQLLNIDEIIVGYANHMKNVINCYNNIHKVVESSFFSTGSPPQPEQNLKRGSSVAGVKSSELEYTGSYGAKGDDQGFDKNMGIVVYNYLYHSSGVVSGMFNAITGLLLEVDSYTSKPSKSGDANLDTVNKLSAGCDTLSRSSSSSSLTSSSSSSSLENLIGLRSDSSLATKTSGMIDEWFRSLDSTMGASLVPTEYSSKQPDQPDKDVEIGTVFVSRSQSMDTEADGECQKLESEQMDAIKLLRFVENLHVVVVFYGLSHYYDFSYLQTVVVYSPFNKKNAMYKPTCGSNAHAKGSEASLASRGSKDKVDHKNAQPVPTNGVVYMMIVSSSVVYVAYQSPHIFDTFTVVPRGSSGIKRTTGSREGRLASCSMMGETTNAEQATKLPQAAKQHAKGVCLLNNGRYLFQQAYMRFGLYNILCGVRCVFMGKFFIYGRLLILDHKVAFVSPLRNFWLRKSGIAQISLKGTKLVIYSRYPERNFTVTQDSTPTSTRSGGSTTRNAVAGKAAAGNKATQLDASNATLSQTAQTKTNLKKSASMPFFSIRKKTESGPQPTTSGADASATQPPTTKLKKSTSTYRLKRVGSTVKMRNNIEDFGIDLVNKNELGKADDLANKEQELGAMFSFVFYVYKPGLDKVFVPGGQYTEGASASSTPSSGWQEVVRGSSGEWKVAASTKGSTLIRKSSFSLPLNRNTFALLDEDYKSPSPAATPTRTLVYVNKQEREEKRKEEQFRGMLMSSSASCCCPFSVSSGSKQKNALVCKPAGSASEEGKTISINGNYKQVYSVEGQIAIELQQTGGDGCGYDPRRGAGNQGSGTSSSSSSDSSSSCAGDDTESWLGEQFRADPQLTQTLETQFNLSQYCFSGFADSLSASASAQSAALKKKRKKRVTEAAPSDERSASLLLDANYRLSLSEMFKLVLSSNTDNVSLISKGRVLLGAHEFEPRSQPVRDYTYCAAGPSTTDSSHEDQSPVSCRSSSSSTASPTCRRDTPTSRREDNFHSCTSTPTAISICPLFPSDDPDDIEVVYSDPETPNPCPIFSNHSNKRFETNSSTLNSSHPNQFVGQEPHQLGVLLRKKLNYKYKLASILNRAIAIEENLRYFFFSGGVVYQSNTTINTAHYSDCFNNIYTLIITQLADATDPASPSHATSSATQTPVTNLKVYGYIKFNKKLFLNHIIKSESSEKMHKVTALIRNELAPYLCRTELGGGLRLGKFGSTDELVRDHAGDREPQPAQLDTKFEPEFKAKPPLADDQLTVPHFTTKLNTLFRKSLMVTMMVVIVLVIASVFLQPNRLKLI